MTELSFAPHDFDWKPLFFPTPVRCRVCAGYLGAKSLTLTRPAIERIFEPYRRFVADPSTKLPTDILVCGHPLYLCSDGCLTVLCLNPDLVLS